MEHFSPQILLSNIECLLDCKPLPPTEMVQASETKYKPLSRLTWDKHLEILRI